MKHLLLTASLFAIASRSGAAVLTTLPTPMNQGGMIHINVAFNEITSALTAVPEPGTPVIQALSAWKPGDTFAPSSPWYATLDPTQAAGMFNSQFGLVLFESDPLPAGSQIMVGLVSKTPGLDAFQWKNTDPQNFTGILGTDGSDSSWNWGSVAHGMTHPMFVMPAGSNGTAEAILSFTLTDGSGIALPGYSTAQATLNFTVVPEPSALLLSSLAGLLILRRRRSHSIES
jgi:hypothetical protein